MSQLRPQYLNIMIAIYYEHRFCVWVVVRTVSFRKCSHRVGRSRVEGTCPQGKQSLTRTAGSCSQKWVAECLWHEESGEWNWLYKNSTGQFVKHCETDPCAETLKCTLPKGLGMSKRIKFCIRSFFLMFTCAAGKKRFWSWACSVIRICLIWIARRHKIFATGFVCNRR